MLENHEKLAEILYQEPPALFRFVTVNNKLFEVGILTISAVLTNCVRN